MSAGHQSSLCKTLHKLPGIKGRVKKHPESVKEIEGPSFPEDRDGLLLLFRCLFHGQV